MPLVTLTFVCFIRIGDLMNEKKKLISVRFPNMGPHNIRQPHVSSSTHPQNMGKYIYKRIFIYQIVLNIEI